MYRSKTRLDIRDRYPAGMEAYLSEHGWHFSKPMVEWAVSRMRKAGPDGTEQEVKCMTREEVEQKLARYGVKLQYNEGYDHVYVYHMGMTNLLGSSITDEQHLALYVKNVIDDPDGYDGQVFSRFYMDCNGSGSPIPWPDMI